MRWRVALAGLVCVIMIAFGLPGAQAETGETATDAESADETIRRSCTRERVEWRDVGPSERGRPSQLAGELPPQSAWVADEASANAARRLARTVENRFPEVFNVTTDLARGTLTVVVDAEHVDQVERVRSAVAGSEIPVEVVLSCYPRSELDPILATVNSEEWRELLGPSHATLIEPLVGRVVILYDGTDRGEVTLRDAVTRTFGDRVQIIRTEIGHTSGPRHASQSPHYGGAGIRPAFVHPPRFPHNQCTANALVFFNGQPRMITAGHCFTNLSNWLWQAGATDTHIGNEVSRHPNYPTYDLAMLRPASGQQFQARIYTGWNTGSQNHPVSGQINQVPIGESVCLSGGTTGTNCDYVVWLHNVSVTAQGQTTHHLDMAWAPYQVIWDQYGYYYSRCSGGDSGAPLFRWAPGQSSVRMVGVAQSVIPIADWGIVACYYHNAGVVQQEYGSYATS